jgi:hypothetical protein
MNTARIDNPRHPRSRNLQPTPVCGLTPLAETTDIRHFKKGRAKKYHAALLHLVEEEQHDRGYVSLFFQKKKSGFFFFL